MRNFRFPLALLAASFLCVQIFPAFADVLTTPTNVSAGDETVLHSSITAAALTVTLEPLYKYVNGVRTKGCIDSANGFAIITDTTSRFEWLSFSNTACNTTTYITTLTGVRRGLSPVLPTLNAGTGLAWDAGSKFRIIDYPWYYKKTAYQDRPIILSASGGLTFTGSGRLKVPVFANSTVRDAQIPNPANGMIVYNTTEGLLDQYISGSWTTISTGSTSNATTTVAGKVELGTVADQLARTDTGDSGASTVVVTKFLTESGAQNGANNSPQRGRVIMANLSGAVSATLGGLGRPNVASGSVILAQGSGAVKAVAPGTANNVLQSNGTSWVSGGTKVYTQPVYMTGAVSTVIGASSTAEVAFDKCNYTIPASDLVKDVAYQIEATGVLGWGAGDWTLRTKLGATAIILNAITPATSGDIFRLHAIVLGKAAAGASVSVEGGYNLIYGQGGSNMRAMAANGNAAVATNGTLLLQLSSQFGTNNGSNSAQILDCVITKVSKNGFTPI